MIYGYCLIYDGDIIPYPSTDEREEIAESGEKAAKLCIERRERKGAMTVMMKRDLRACGGITYAEDWPCIALLAVNKSIQEEAANVLFGKNVWRLSYFEQWKGQNSSLWFSYAGYFRHITTQMSMNDVGNMVQHIKERRAFGKKHGWSAKTLQEDIHGIGLFYMDFRFEWKRRMLMRMNLKSLVFDVENLFCPHGCCREEVLEYLCECMGLIGLGYERKVDEQAVKSWDALTHLFLDSETKHKTGIKVIGLENDSEMKIFKKRTGRHTCNEVEVNEGLCQSLHGSLCVHQRTRIS